MAAQELVHINGDGIEWNGLFGNVTLRAMSNNDAGADLIQIFSPETRQSDSISVAVEFPWSGDRQETRKVTGSVEHFSKDDEFVEVWIKCVEAPQIQITKRNW